MDKKHYIILAAVSYLLFLVITAPAAPVLAYVLKQTPGMQIQGVTGTIWNGRAQNISINAVHRLSDTNWSLVLWRLLTGEAGAEVSVSYNNNPVNGYVGVDVTGTVTARHISAELDAAKLGQTARIPLGELSGRIALNLDYLAWNGTDVPTSHGIIRWSGAAITVAEKADLGEVSITLIESDSDPLVADISNKGGQLSVKGRANVNDSGEYTVELNMKPNAGASANLERSLAMFAKKQSDGNYLLNNTGNLKQLGLM